MATKRWVGGAQSVAQVTTISFSAYTSGQTYRIICNGKTLAFVATASTAANVIAGLIALVNASTEKEFLEFVASDGTTNVTLTGSTAGKPFTVTASATTGSPTVTEVTAATGPNHWNNASNWSGAALPAAADDLILEAGSTSVLYGLTDTNVYASLTIDSTFTGTVGLPITNESGYREYRDRYLKLGDGTGTIVVSIGAGAGTKSSRLNLDFNQATLSGRVYGTGTSQDANEGPLAIRNTDSSSTLTVHSGAVLINADSAGTLSTLKVLPDAGGVGGQGARVIVDSTVAAGAITMNGGSLELRGTATSANVSFGAQLKLVGGATCPTVTFGTQAKVIWSSTAGITTLTGQNGGEISFAGETTGKTVTNASIGVGCVVSDPSACVTWTNGITLSACRLKDVQIDFGSGVVVKRV